MRKDQMTEITAWAHRRHGPSDEARKATTIALAETEWTARCRKCGVELKGTPASLKAHVCDADVAAS